MLVIRVKVYKNLRIGAEDKTVQGGDTFGAHFSNVGIYFPLFD